MTRTHNAGIDSPFLGIWRNTNPSSTGILQVTFAAGNSGLTLRVDSVSQADSFATQVESFLDEDAATLPEKILARQDLAWGNLVMHGWIKQGVLVLAIFRRLNIEEDRSNSFDREFFYRADGPL